VSEKPHIFVNPKSGSIRISGEVDFIDADGVVVRTESNVKLCGCGRSKDKPYCDGSHKEATTPVESVKKE
jgi:2-oxopent-4-enoate/cis-2-oxohex-4-enoate hydratase